MSRTLLTLLAIATLTPSLCGQVMRITKAAEDALRADYVQRDLPVMYKMLGLGEDQKLLVDQFFADYEAAVREGIEALRKELEGSGAAAAGRPGQAEVQQRLQELLAQAREVQQRTQSGEDPEAVKEDLRARALELQELMEAQNTGEAAADVDVAALRQKVEAWREAKAELGRQFAASVQSILRAEQLPLWSPLDRHLTRQKTLPRGRLSGETVNLLDLVTDLRLASAEHQVLTGTLEAYEIALHESLQAREKTVASTRIDLSEAEAATDVATAVALMQQEARARIAVRDVNERFAAAITEQLPPEAVARFRELFDTRAFPRVFRPTRAERVLRAAEQLPDLSDQARQSVASLQSQYAAELESANADLVRTLREVEPVEPQRRLEQRQAAREGRTPEAEDPLRDAFSARNQLDERYLAQLRGVLTPEQFSQLPGVGARSAAPAGTPGRGEPTSSEGWRQVLEQFDADGDGRLDDAERARAREHFRRGRSRDGGR